MAPVSGHAYILDNDGNLVYKEIIGQGDGPSTVTLNGNIVSIYGDAYSLPDKSSQDTPDINTVGITISPIEAEGTGYVTKITLPFAPTSIKYNSGTHDQNFDNTTNYIEVTQGQSVETELNAGYSTGGGLLLQYFGQAGGGGSMSKSVDLTTLTGWANLSDGEHTITIKAKADGYRDSEASEGVSVTKGSTGETWVLTDGILTNALSMSNGDSREFSIDFVSNSQQFDKFRIEGHGISIDEEYDIGGAEQYVFFVAGTYSRQVGNITMSEEYRTITFETSPTGDLLTWLQANGTKQ